MHFTDLFIRRPVLAIVLNLLILAVGIRTYLLLPVREYPATQSAIINVLTTYPGADQELIAGFITTPLEQAIARSEGIDYMTSTSSQGSSLITIHMRLNYDANRALAQVNAQVNSVLNQLPRESQLPNIRIASGQSIQSSFLSFSYKEMTSYAITDYLLRNVQPKLNSIEGIERAVVWGGQGMAMRVWLDPAKLAGLSLTPADISRSLAINNFVTAVGRATGDMVVERFSIDTGLNNVDGFRNMVIKVENGSIVRLKDVGIVSLGATDYDSEAFLNNEPAVFINLLASPTTNVLAVTNRVKNVFPSIVQQLPATIKGKFAYDVTEFISKSIKKIVQSLIEALIIITIVVFFFLGSIRSLIVPVIAIPLSLIGTFSIMYLLHYSFNLLTILALVLAIGLVVDDAIIIVENVHRHMEKGLAKLDAALLGARELARPILGILIVTVTVYVPIAFRGGLTGALFTEFAVTLVSAVAISTVVALTLSPMMCSKLLALPENENTFSKYIDDAFNFLKDNYYRALLKILNSLSVMILCGIIILLSIWFLFTVSRAGLVPQEDEGAIYSDITTLPNASLKQTQIYSNKVREIFNQYPETIRSITFDGYGGLNTSTSIMILKPWEERRRSSTELQLLLQSKFNNIIGATVAAYQPSSLPGSGGFPIQFVIGTTEPYTRLHKISENLLSKAKQSGLFAFLDSSLKIDMPQTNIILNRDKASELGLSMQAIGNILSSALSENYINYFNFYGRSYQVIAQMKPSARLNSEQLLNYYVTTADGKAVPFSTIAHLEKSVIPESLDHFQQVNSAIISAIPGLGVSLGEAIDKLESIAKEVLPLGYSVDYAGQTRQFVQESHSFNATIIFVLIVIFLTLAGMFESFRDPLIILISVPMSIFGAMIFIVSGVGGVNLNIYTEVGLITLIGLISKHGILIVQFAHDLQKQGKNKKEAILIASTVRLRPILMTTAAMVLGVFPLLFASGAGAASQFNIGLVIASGISIGTLFTLFFVPSMYILVGKNLS